MASKIDRRIVRQANPTPMKGVRGYGRFRDCLRSDFGNRCAYCLIHESIHPDGFSGFQIDHFNPRSKGGSKHAYDNLYWSCAWCNLLKSDHWPTKSEAKRGVRFVDPCAERDYGVAFVEKHGILHPQSRRGRYHIDHIRLNRETRKQLRLERTRLANCMKRAMSLLAKLKAKPHHDTILHNELVVWLKESHKIVRKRFSGLPPMIRP